MYYNFSNICKRLEKKIYRFVDTTFEIINMDNFDSSKFCYVHENETFELVSADKTKWII